MEIGTSKLANRNLPVSRPAGLPRAGSRGAGRAAAQKATAWIRPRSVLMQTGVGVLKLCLGAVNCLPVHTMCLSHPYTCR